MHDEMDEEMEMKKAGLRDVMQYAKGGMARDMRERNGRPMPDEEMPPGEDPDAPIPGVEGEEDGVGDAGLSEIPPELLKRILEKLGAGGA